MSGTKDDDDGDSDASRFTADKEEIAPVTLIETEDLTDPDVYERQRKLAEERAAITDDDKGDAEAE